MGAAVDSKPLVIRHEDDDVVVISKPAGQVSLAGTNQSPVGTTAEAAVTQWPNLAAVGPKGRNGLVHRLDKDTSGLLLIAKNEKAFEALTKQFADRIVEKRYEALVDGTPEVPRGRIDAPVTRHYAKREKMAVHPEGKTAETKYEVRETIGDYALLDVWPSTGRTHQIRVHLAALGHPVVGDTTYGIKQRPIGLDRQFLHAAQISFTHPSTGKRIKVSDPLPADLDQFLKDLPRG